jgi:UDP-galactopyranose mutase
MVKGQFSGHYDVLLVGAGLYNAVLAHRFQKMGLKVCVVERRPGDEIGGNCATEERDGIMIHKYGAHIFHTSDKSAWEFANQFAHFTPFINSPVAITHLRDGDTAVAVNLPFNMNTFSRVFGVTTPEEAKKRIAEETEKYIKASYSNLKEKALSLVGEKLFDRLIRGYTEKQWGRSCEELSPDIITRIPLRFTYDNNYFNDTYQGIPDVGYSQWIKNMFGDCTFFSGVDYLSNREEFDKLADHIFYSGRVDEFFGFKYGELEYRSLKFITKKFDTDNYQGVAVRNFTEKTPSYTRMIEHRHFMPTYSQNMITPNTSYVTYEYPANMADTNEPFYSVNNSMNDALYARYKAECPSNVTFVGRLGMYKYNDMDDTIISALIMDLSRFAKKN